MLRDEDRAGAARRVGGGEDRAAPCELDRGAGRAAGCDDLTGTLFPLVARDGMARAPDGGLTRRAVDPLERDDEDGSATRRPVLPLGEAAGGVTVVRRPVDGRAVVAEPPRGAGAGVTRRVGCDAVGARAAELGAVPGVGATRRVGEGCDSGAVASLGVSGRRAVVDTGRAAG